MGFLKEIFSPFHDFDGCPKKNDREQEETSLISKLEAYITLSNLGFQNK